MLICWPARNEVWGTQGHKRGFIHTCVCPKIFTKFVGQCYTTGCLVSLCLIKRYEQPFKLLPNSRSFTERHPCEFRVKWRVLSCHAATSEATYRSPACCLKVVQVRPVFEHPTVPAFYGLIQSFQEHQAGCPTFFSSKYHTDSLISQLLNFPPHIFDFISNLSNPVLSCLLIGSALWTREWLPSGWRLQRSMELWWNWAWQQRGLVLSTCTAVRRGQLILRCVILHHTTERTAILPAIQPQRLTQ